MNVHMLSNTGHRLIKNGQLHLYGAVGSGFSEDRFFTDTEVVDALEKCAGDLVVRINSGGGSAIEGIAIYNALREYPHKITVYVDALAASAASVIAMAGDKVIMRLASQMMIHDPSMVSAGTAEKLERDAEKLRKLSERAATIYQSKSGLSKDQVLKIMSDETWFDAEEAVEAGFADYYEGQTEEIVPSFAYTEHFFNTPEMVLASMAHGLPLRSAKSERKTTMKSNTSTKEVSQETATDVVMRGTGLLTYARERADKCGLSQQQSEAVMSSVAKKPKGATDKDISDAILAQLATPFDGPAPRSDTVYDNTLENPEFCNKAIQSAVLAQIEGRRLDINDPGEVFQNLSLPEMAIRRARMGGIPERELQGSRGLKRALNFQTPQMAGGGYGVGDFPGVLAPIVERVTVDQTEVFTTELIKLARPHNFDGYNPSRFEQASGMDDLPENNEHDKIKFINVDVDYEDISAGVNAGQISISERALRGDTTGIIQGQINNTSRAAAGVVNKKIRSAILGSNGQGSELRDGKTLFHADRNNLATTGASISEASLSEAEKFILNQKIGDEKEPAGFKPKYLLVGPELKTAAQKMIASITPANADDVNPFSNALELLVDPAIQDNSWRLFADHVQAPVLVGGYMDGAQGPQVDVEESFDVLGMKFRIVVRYGAGLIGWRGCFMNPGE